MKHMHLLGMDKCPHCGHACNAASCDTSDDCPEPGDLSICIYCTAFLVFDDFLKLQLLPEEEIAELPAGLRSELIRLRKELEEHKPS